ncbi:NucA/NucB deoxyribonuclease domain-containing protein [Actinomadura geliboluensis]|uniref:NucA/NucB deoxyribonuclease domain-containing protein n=1 Tax=Actinomadura geliboluensis TaxID=882440 RepID=UPI0036B068EF
MTRSAVSNFLRSTGVVGLLLAALLTPARAASAAPAPPPSQNQGTQGAPESLHSGRFTAPPSSTGFPDPKVRQPRASTEQTCDELKARATQLARSGVQTAVCIENAPAPPPSTKGMEPDPTPQVFPRWCDDGRAQQQSYAGSRFADCSTNSAIKATALSFVTNPPKVIGEGYMMVKAFRWASGWNERIFDNTIKLNMYSSWGVMDTGAMSVQATVRCTGDDKCEQIAESPLPNQAQVLKNKPLKGWWRFKSATVNKKEHYLAPKLKFFFGGELTYQPETLLPYSSYIRCDTKNLQQPTADQGCVMKDFQPIYKVYLDDTDPLTGTSEVALHIQDAQNQTSHHWGRLQSLGNEPDGEPLSRLINKDLQNRNRTEACGNRNPGAGESCDEYPFASTRQGAALEGKNDYSWRNINENHNSKEGSLRGAWYNAYRVMDWDKFWVRVCSSHNDINCINDE